MLRSLLRDCAEALPQCEITMLRDARLPPLSSNSNKNVCVINVTHHFMQAWQDALEHTEAVWIIAPETGGVLPRLAQAAQAAGKCVLNSSAQAIALCSSKLKTAAHLQAQGIQVVPTFRYRHEYLPSSARNGPVVVKPDDGAGCLDTYVFANAQAVVGSHEVIQPYISGKAMSVSLWCEAGVATLLSINEQRIVKIAGQLKFEGCTVNAMNATNTAIELLGQFQALTNAIARAVPGLWGPVGVDLVLNETLIVIEINPRMTTSFTKLREACNINIASLIKTQVSAL
jgi:tyramine---L-glutamate ligase